MSRLVKTNQHNNIYRPKLNGYRSSHRNKWLILEHGIVSEQALLLFEFYLDIFDFDVNHNSFSTFQVDFEEIGKIFHKSPSSIRNWHNELTSKNFIQKTGTRAFYRILNPFRYITYRNPAKLNPAIFAKKEKNQTVETILQSIEQEIQPIEKYLQPVEKNDHTFLEQQDSILLGSSKVGSKFVTKDQCVDPDDIPF